MKHTISKSIIRRGHEIRDVNARGLFWFVVILLVCVVLIHVVVAVIFKHFAGQNPQTFAAETPIVPSHDQWPKPAQQISPEQDLKEFRAAQEKLLHSYGWINREKGIVRIPVERAMGLIVQESSQSKEEKP
jgi:hypothetical protein